MAVQNLVIALVEPVLLVQIEVMEARPRVGVPTVSGDVSADDVERVDDRRAATPEHQADSESTEPPEEITASPLFSCHSRRAEPSVMTSITMYDQYSIHPLSRIIWFESAGIITWARWPNNWTCAASE